MQRMSSERPLEQCTLAPCVVAGWMSTGMSVVGRDIRVVGVETVCHRRPVPVEADTESIVVGNASSRTVVERVSGCLVRCLLVALLSLVVHRR